MIDKIYTVTTIEQSISNNICFYQHKIEDIKNRIYCDKLETIINKAYCNNTCYHYKEGNND